MATPITSTNGDISDLKKLVDKIIAAKYLSADEHDLFIDLARLDSGEHETESALISRVFLAIRRGDVRVETITNPDYLYKH